MKAKETSLHSVLIQRLGFVLLDLVTSPLFRGDTTVAWAFCVRTPSSSQTCTLACTDRRKSGGNEELGGKTGPCRAGHLQQTATPNSLPYESSLVSTVFFRTSFSSFLFRHALESPKTAALPSTNRCPTHPQPHGTRVQDERPARHDTMRFSNVLSCLSHTLRARHAGTIGGNPDRLFLGAVISSSPLPPPLRLCRSCACSMGTRTIDSGEEVSLLVYMGQTKCQEARDQSVMTLNSASAAPRSACYAGICTLYSCQQI